MGCKFRIPGCIVAQGIGKFLEARIDKIGAHGVAGIKSGLHLVIAGQFFSHIHQADVPDTAPAFHHIGRDALGIGEHLAADFGKETVQKPETTLPGEMHLPDFFGINYFAVKAPALGPEFRGTRCRGNHRAFLNNHGDHVHGAVYQEIGRHSIGEIIISEGVFAEFVNHFLNGIVAVPRRVQGFAESLRIRDVRCYKIDFLIFVEARKPGGNRIFFH